MEIYMKETLLGIYNSMAFVLQLQAILIAFQLDGIKMIRFKEIGC